jgi:putative glutathione S-transferase
MSTQFRGWITADGARGFVAEPGRYHLYVSLGCPWAHRTVLLPTLKGLEAMIGFSIVDPVIGEYGWQFTNYPGCILDEVNHCVICGRFMSKLNLIILAGSQFQCCGISKPRRL